MKNILALVLFISASFFVSCSKEEIPAPAVPSATHQVQVEYRVTSVSGHFTVEYMAKEGNVMVSKTETIDRTNFSTAFTCNSGEMLSIKAWNTTPTAKEVKVEIYVDGILFKEGSANTPGATAAAEGRP
jgi:hypothetical protein